MLDQITLLIILCPVFVHNFCFPGIWEGRKINFGHNYIRMDKGITEEENMKVAIDKAITRCWDKMVRDAQRITSYNSEIWEDLLPYTISEFLTKKSLQYQYQVAVIDNKLPNYIGSAMSLQIHSQTSGFWNEYRKESYNYRGLYLEEEKDEYMATRFDDPINTLDGEKYVSPEECIHWALEQIPPYYRDLINLYYFEKMTYEKMHIKFDITFNSLKKDISTGIKLIQKHCKHFI
jgi:hypothetical protein